MFSVYELLISVSCRKTYFRDPFYFPYVKLLHRFDLSMTLISAEEKEAARNVAEKIAKAGLDGPTLIDSSNSSNDSSGAPELPPAPFSK